ncbi:MAG: multicopper oxidase family protein [Pseudomonadota bacterium]
MTTRRHFLAGAASTGLLACGAGAAGAGRAPTLTAVAHRIQLVPEGNPTTEVWSYDAALPGPVIRLARGATLRRELLNALEVPTTVHWHGIRLPNAMDGVPGISQPAVAPGDRFLYDFTVPDPGTYWYHPHVRSWEQVARGLSGALVVEEEAPPEIDREEVLLLDDWRLGPDAQIEESFDSLHDRAHAGRIGNWITVNGRGEWTLSAGRNARLRLRLVNAATARIFSLGVQGMAGWVVALDGHALEVPQPLERLVLAPAQRADLIVDVIGPDAAEAGGEASAFLVSHERDGAFALVSVAIEGEARAERRGPPTPLEPGTVPPLGPLAEARRARLVMEGGAMGGLGSAMLGDEELALRELASRGKVWAFNGQSGVPEAPLLEARQGETVRVAIANRTRWPHAMHLHGHHFREIAEAGAAPGPLRDTLLVRPMAETEIAFVADNPGDWLFHCHMLAHAVGGMQSWIRVVS